MQTVLPSSTALGHSSSRPIASSVPRRIAVAVAATAFVALCARISVPLPFTPVPLTLQNFAVLLVGLTLGPAAGLAAMVLYLAEGAIGMPVFNPQGLGGLLQLFGPTGGYLLSYPFAAAAAGWAVRSLGFRSLYARAAVACTLATIVIFAFGTTWFAQFLHLGTPAVWQMAVAPFLPGEIVKVAAAAGIYSSISRWRRA
ncbi:biotin transporter BioY [Edaphobacter aggregans]|uniref:biotin transporter BioY n=1 Tax=Edaphobacter aggregans TaxID=570835 RepID=UPI00054CEFDE|nr:biotin transporter BioY [Edaphobacter aggregans]